jgi:co-chaperonin GroES (HSP10)
MSLTMNTIKGKLTPIRDNVIVSDMYFGEQKTKSGLIIRDDNGTTRGIYPRWGKVYAKGPENKDPYQVGDWVLIDHGRWTRSVNIDDGDGEKELRMIEVTSILMWSDTKPDGVVIGKEYENGAGVDIRPEDFIR